LALGLLVWLASLWQTQQKLRLEQTAGDSVGGPFGTRSSAL
jgi:hypothetical protein